MINDEAENKLRAERMRRVESSVDAIH